MIRTMVAVGQRATYLKTGDECTIVGASPCGYNGYLFHLKFGNGTVLKGVHFSEFKRVTADVVPIKRSI